MYNTLEMLKQHKLVAIVRRIPNEKIVQTGKALYDAGIRLIEVTFDQKNPDCIKTTSEMIAKLCENFGDKMCIGAGTVLNREQVRAAVDAGAKFVLAPNVNADVIDEAVKLGVSAIPGALTPTEIEYAWSLGAAAVKLFPAGDLGIGYVKSLMGPLNHIPLIAVGGIDQNNLLTYLEAGVIGVGLGSNLVKNSLIEQDKFDELTQLATSFTSLLK